MGNPIAFDLRLANEKVIQVAAPRPWQTNAAFGAKFEGKEIFTIEKVLDSGSDYRGVVEYGSNAAIFTQGDPATSVLYIREGGVKLTVVNESGKEAVVAVLGPRDFFGEGCLAGQSYRVNTAATTIRSTILMIEKSEMIQRLHAEQALSDRFIKHILLRNARFEQDLTDQLINSSEKRLARTLLLLAHYGQQEKPALMVSDISQEILAEMVGTTRSRINFFMNKFRKQGFIEYGSKLQGLRINKSLLEVVSEN